MSGVEIIGLLLGAFPLLISAAEHYKEGFEPLVKWKRFRLEFLKFLDGVIIEKHLYDMMLEQLLISADVQHEDMCLFTTDPHYYGWQREDIIDKLKLRLGPSFDAFMSTLREMNELMTELKSSLSLKNGQIEWASDGASKWDYQMKRIHHSFSKKGTKALASLEVHNRKLRELVDSSEKLDTIKTTKKKANIKWGEIFECIRRHANSLHRALQGAWACECAPHTISLRLEKRKAGGWSSTFDLAFSVPKNGSRAVSTRQDLIVKTRNGNKPEEIMVTELNREHYLYKNIDSLRPHFENISVPNVNALSQPTPSSSFEASNITTLKISSEELVTGSSRSTSDVLSKHETECATEATKSSFFSGRRMKMKKSVKIWEGLTALPVRPQPTPLVRPQTIHTEVMQIPEKIEIKDLCSTIRLIGDSRMCLGYISDGENDHELYLAPNTESFLEDSYISLQTLLSSQSSFRLSQKDRYRLSSILASSLLQLQNTSWLMENMEKKNIYFYQQGTSILLEKPYIRHSFAPNKSSSAPTAPVGSEPDQSPSTRFAARNSLSNLGILLLELCFGQAIEDQEIRKHYLGPDGKPHQGTDYMTARDWAEMVWDEDPAWESIIKCCIFCMFEEKADWENKKFMQAVYAGVVEPLDKISSKWEVF